MDTKIALVTAIASMAAGYAFFRLALLILPGRLAASNRKQKSEVLREAKIQAETICDDLLKRADANIQILREDLEESINERKEDLKTSEEDLERRESLLETEESQMTRLEGDMETIQRKVQSMRDISANLEGRLESNAGELKRRLEEASRADANELKLALKRDLIESRQLECQKVLRIASDELASSGKKSAQRIMSRAMARYAPEFPWPKMLNHVEIESARLADEIEANPQLVLDMKELAGIEIELSRPENPDFSPLLRLSGGAGVERESARLTLQELIAKGPSAWTKSKEAYARHREAIEQQATKLGRQAVLALQLDNIHPEVQKLVGYLNWRTSYRQNQYLHSFEVAVLAGVVASELGVDPADAKRCGLLHDIGKALDYRIEGSHAVISGDYADRFGERRLICDTVMSHHNDLILETPLAFVLKTADTLSGARPGARVNLEEGYQIRLNAIDEVIRSFPGVTKSAIMNGGREVHVEVSHKRIKDADLQQMSTEIAKRIETDVAFPGQIKVQVTRRFEATSVA
ncbi:MAG: ribonuclease [Pseudomonadota bacterium]|jgi:ribonuclease Y